MSTGFDSDTRLGKEIEKKNYTQRLKTVKKWFSQMMKSKTLATKLCKLQN